MRVALLSATKIKTHYYMWQIIKGKTNHTQWKVTRSASPKFILGSELYHIGIIRQFYSVTPSSLASA